VESGSEILRQEEEERLQAGGVAGTCLAPREADIPTHSHKGLYLFAVGFSETMLKLF
jgi:hypothetical protein